MRIKHHAGWSTKFGSWIESRSVPALCSDLRARGLTISSHVIYSWVAGRRMPQLRVAAELVKLSKDALTVQDMIQHAETARNWHGCRQKPLAD